MTVVCPRCGVAMGLLEPLDREAVVHRACQTCWPYITGHPLRFIYVDRRQPKLFRELLEEYRGDPTVVVLFDRRGADRRRRADRRAAQRPTAADRRAGAERRKQQLGIVVRGRPTA